MNRTAERPRVVVLGAGFGGLWAARELAGEPVDVVVLDRNNFHTFQPLLYQVGTAGLEGSEVVYPVRKILREWKNVHFRMAEVTAIDLDAREVVTDRERLAYDYLLLATGSKNAWLGVEGAGEHAYPLKELSDAVALRNHALACFEAAAMEEDPELRRELLTFVVVGGGPTGVELAGAMAELGRHPMSEEYEEFGRDDIRVLLLEASDGLLPGVPDELGTYVTRRLRRMGVEVHTSSPVRRVEANAVETRGGERFGTRTVAWAAGVEGAPPAGGEGLPVTDRGWVRVGPTLQLERREREFAVGDLALFNGNRLPLVAPAAIQEGEHAARNVLRLLRGEAVEPFEYHDKGILGAIGRNAAYARSWGRNITGFPAWIVWLVIHIRELMGFRNRLVVLVNWLWDYFLFERPVRWIMPEWRDRVLSGLSSGSCEDEELAVKGRDDRDQTSS